MSDHQTETKRNAAIHIDHKPLSFQIRLAELCIEIHQLNRGIRHYCRDYIIEGSVREGDDISASDRIDGSSCRDDSVPDLVLGITEADLTEENERAIHYFGYGMSSARELEKLWLYREIAEHLPFRDTFLMHAAAIAVDGDGYLFTGPSGTGKTTHIKLWKKLFDERMTIINDDKPLIRVGADEIRIFGSPWCGKERLNQNTSAPLAGIVCLEQAKENRITRLPRQAAWERLMNQIYRSRNAEALERTLALTDRLISGVPVYLMQCNMKKDAARMAYAALTTPAHLYF